LITNAQGLSLFSFGGHDMLRAPTDVAVDSEGRIYVQVSENGGRTVNVFDYNGDYLGPFPFKNLTPASVHIESLVIDDQDRLYLLDGVEKRILVYDLSGNPLFEFPLFEELSEELRRQQVLGNLFIYGETIYIPAAMLGSVYCYGKDGSLLRLFGHRGSAFGELSFPIAVSVDGRGNMLVLDKNRHTIVGFTPEGKVLGEFGGRGVGSGWFCYPNSMLVDSHDRIWVSQVFNNRVQVLNVTDE
jgi:DNA-binding beta-propeller fold protein YncE